MIGFDLARTLEWDLILGMSSPLDGQPLWLQNRWTPIAPGRPEWTYLTRNNLQ